MEYSDELKALLGERWKPEEDVEQNRSRRDQLIAAPAGPAERAAQEAYLAAVKERAALGGNAALSERQRRVAMAARELEENLRTYEFLWDRPADQRAAPEWEEAVRGVKINAAANAFVLGDFALAVQLSPDDHEAEATYREYLDAELRDDDDLCECPRTRTSEEIAHTKGAGAVPVRRTIELNNLVPAGDFPSPRRNCWVWAHRCLVCGMLNLRRELDPTAAHERLATTTTADVPTHFAPRSAPGGDGAV